MSILKTISCGLCCISAAVITLVYMSLGQSLSLVTEKAIEAIQNNPDITVQILTALILGSVIPILLFGVLAFIVAKKLLCVAKRSCDSDC